MADRLTNHDDVVTSMLPVIKRRSFNSPGQSLFLARLARLVQLEEEWRQRSPTDDWRMRLIYRGIYSTYRDCVAAGVAEEAQELLRRSRPARAPEDLRSG